MSKNSEKRNDQVEPLQIISTGRPDKGLPDEKALLDLARTYLELQHRLWPQLVGNLLPAMNDSEIEAMAAAFRERFLSGRIERFQPEIDSPSWLEIAAAYLRYSCDNSNPRSLDQQLRDALERAAHDKVFIPWEYVFADAAVSGTTAARRGYLMIKTLISDKQATLRRVYINELGRASRDAIEALKLGQLIEQYRKRLIGTSDGFDSDSPNSKFLLSMYAMLHEWFVDQLRSKVNRGMTDAFDRGGNLRPPSVGYKLIPKLDANGEPIFKQNGKAVREKIIDEAEVKHIEEAFRLFSEKSWSPDKISRRFNALNVGGKPTWDRGRIKQLLNRETYIGIEYEWKTTKLRDPETGRVTIIKRPRAEWKRREVPHLRIISDDLWDKAQERLRKCREAYELKKKENSEQPSRADVYPTTLLRPTCGHCGKELWLGRAGKYASFVCLNGRDHKNGCKLLTYKAVHLVETAVLERLKNEIFTPKYLKHVFAEANQFLAEQANRPLEDTEPLHAEIKQVKAKRDRLVQVLEQGPEHELESIVEQVRRHERRLKELRQKLADTKSRNVTPPPPMTMADLEKILLDLHAVLSQDVAIAAPVLAKLTGPISMTQGEHQGRKGTPWIAKFQLDLAAGLAAMGCASDSPYRQTWEYLHAHSVQVGDSIELIIEEIPDYELLAPKVKKLHDQKPDLSKIRKTLGVTWITAKAALRFAETGERPARRGQKAEAPQDKAKPIYQELAPVVAKMYDEDKLPFVEVIQRLKREGISVGVGTVIAAYQHFHRDKIAAAIASGEIKRRKRPRLSAEAKQEIEQLLLAGELSVIQIANRFGCRRTTIYRLKDQFDSPQEHQESTDDSQNQRRSA